MLGRGRRCRHCRRAASGTVGGQALVGLIAHWRKIGDKAQWLLEAVAFECLAYWQERGLRSPALRRPLRHPGWIISKTSTAACSSTWTCSEQCCR
jgi:hypothetical protein